MFSHARQPQCLLLPSMVLLFIHLALCLFSLPAAAVAGRTVSLPKAVIALTGKDGSLYAVSLEYNPTAFPYLLDISSPFLSSACPGTKPSIPCTSASCSSAVLVSKFSSPRCYSQTTSFANHPAASATASPPSPCKSCMVFEENPLTGKCTAEELTVRQINVNLLGYNQTPPTETPIRFTSLCSNANDSLPRIDQGIVGFGRSSPLAVPAQLASSLRLKNQFTLCLTRNLEQLGEGVVVFGEDLRAYFPKRLNVRLSYSPLVKNPKLPSRYYLGVQAIKVSGKTVALPASVFDFDPQGRGGVELSTTVPYTVLRRDIYKPFLAAYVRAGAKARAWFPPPVKSVGVHDFCVDKSRLVGAAPWYRMPPIQFALGDGVLWNVSSWNSFVDVGDNTTCLAFVDGGVAAERAVVVGLFQIENNYLVFDLAKSTLGFAGYLWNKGPQCGEYFNSHGASTID